MDKNAIKKYAVWARRELIARVSQRAALYEITADGYGDIDAVSVHGRILSLAEKNQRRALIAQIQQKGFEQVMEEIAYTWFNRFSALRFMEVNGYLPSRIRVFTDEENHFKPQIMTEAINLEMDGLDMQKVFAFKDANDGDGLFKYLIITQCNALSSILPGMFQKIADFTELLFPDNLLRQGSVVEQMVSMIPEEDWTDQVQIIGWLYQYYNTEPKDQVFANLKKNIKISKENIPAATQLFTPDWIVRYMVENSLGRLWVEGHPNDELKASWKYYLDEAEQEEEVQKQLAEIKKEYAALKPEDIRCIDPCMGSGHILVYMFDVLVQIYESYGYSAREAASSIIKNNIWGLDIDERAAQLAYFSVIMKARQYDRRFLERKVWPHVYSIEESNGIFSVSMFDIGSNLTQEEIDKAKKQASQLVKDFRNAKEYGSIINVTPCDWKLLLRYISISKRNGQVFLDVDGKEEIFAKLKTLINIGITLTQKYDVVVTNPPYMGINSMGGNFYEYVIKNHEAFKHDLYCVFINVCKQMLKMNRYQAMITQQSFMFNSRYEKARIEIIDSFNCINLLHLGARAFDEIGGEVVQTTTFVFRRHQQSEYTGLFMDLQDGVTEKEKEKKFLKYKLVKDRKSKIYNAKLSQFMKIDGHNFSYWLSKNIIEILTKEKKISTYSDTRHGLVTGNGDKFMRLWHEVNVRKICFDRKDESVPSSSKWFPYCKGGAMRRWYGNREYIVNWYNDGFEIRNYRDSNRRLKSSNYNSGFIFRTNITWTDLSTGKFSARLSPNGSLFDTSGPALFLHNEKNILYLLGLMNTCVMQKFLDIFCTGLHYSPGSVGTVPMKYMPNERIVKLVERNVLLAMHDYNSFECSWEFKRHPFVCGLTTIKEAFTRWQNESVQRFLELKNNEEELNRIFIDIYGLHDELRPEIADKDITVLRADNQRDVRSFLSYAVGCMFGRYSLDAPGLIFAGGEWDVTKYKTFEVDSDAIIPICDDEYFNDDIVSRFIKFVEVVYGKETLEENLKFIADALGGTGTSREIIRNYFINGFYADHLKIYQKRPIYWLFDSGKKNGFKCLVYMHRYQPDTIARIRTDYVHEQQSRYRTAMADLQNRIDNATTTSERVKLTKRLKTVREQDEELRIYEEKIHHLADQMIKIDLDDGVKVNYAKFQDVLAKIK